MTIRMVGDEVALADLLGIEAIRILQPEMFAAIVQSAEALGATQNIASGYLSGHSPSEGPLAALVNVDRALAETICRWLFPAGRRHFENMNYGPEWMSSWRKERKIASPSVFRFYLERRLPDGVVPVRVIADVVDNLVDPDHLTAALADLSQYELADVVVRLTESAKDIEFDTDGELERDPARTALPALLDLLPKLPIGHSGPFDFGPAMTIARLAHQMLKRIPDEEQRTTIVRGVLSDTAVLSAQLTLLHMVGHRENVGTELISADAANTFEAALRETVISISAEAFAAEPNVLALAALMVETDPGKEALMAFAGDDAVMFALLRDARGESQSWAMGSAAVTTTEVLYWDELNRLLGQHLLMERIVSLMERVVNREIRLADDDYLVLGLASKYGGGWRPNTAAERMMGSAAAPQNDPGADESEPDACYDSTDE